MTSEESRVFKLLDEYSRDRHNCFLSEMFLNEAKTGYTLCFRPVSAKPDSADRFAHRYLHFKVSEVKMAAEKEMLMDSVTEELDRELRPLGLT
jgi:hypothetical protein